MTRIKNALAALLAAPAVLLQKVLGARAAVWARSWVWWWLSTAFCIFVSLPLAFLSGAVEGLGRVLIAYAELRSMGLSTEAARKRAKEIGVKDGE